MCGIVGYISKDDDIFSKQKAHFMRFALALDTLRGFDSTGVMTATKNMSVNTIKTTMPGDKFVQSLRYQDKVFPGWAQVGHNRAATKGKVKLENAHPFNFKDIFLVHNGTLFTEGRSLRTFKNNLEVDSMQIAHALAEHSPKEAKEVIEQIDGSFALVWFDLRDKSINMTRNSDRPMHFGFNVAQSIMWFMSDGNHLNVINNSFGKDTSRAQVLYSLDKNRILKWKKGRMVPEVTEFDPFVYQNKIITSGSSHAGKKRAETKAQEKWNNALKKGSGSGTSKQTNGYGQLSDELRTPINGKPRKVPKPHQTALLEEFELTDNDLLKFQPKEIFELGNHNMMVFGEVTIPAWGDCEWEAVIQNAKELQVKAYSDQAWLVRPIGVGIPASDGCSTGSVLCHLIHCKWDRYEAATSLKNNTEDETTPEETNPDAWVKGPDGKYVSLRVLRPKVENGCITCTSALDFNDLEECVYVNEGRDILCKGCQLDLAKNAVQLLN